MAHCRRKGSAHLVAACVAALAATAFEAAAITLGEARVRSSLGEPLDLRIPVTLDAGESIEPGCFKLRGGTAGDVPRMAGGRVSIVRSSGATSLRVQSPDAVNAPALLVSIVATCAGQSTEYRRDYSLLIDPAGAAARGATPSLHAIAATLMARIGDTLESIAHAIFPDNRGVRKSYIEALRETNPRLAVLGDNEPIPVDTPISLPDLRTFAHAQQPRHTQVATAASEEPRAPARATRTTAPDAAAELAQQPKPRESPRRAQRVSAAKATPVEPASPPKAAARPPASETPAVETRSTPARERPAAPATTRTREGAFVLKLSTPEVDLSPSRSIDERKRQQLRERQMILDQDDQVAALLALRHSVQQLETRVAELQLKLAAMPSSFPPPKAAIAPIEPPVVSAAPSPQQKPAASAPPEPPKAATAPVETKAAPAPVQAKPAMPATPAEAKPAPAETKPAQRAADQKTAPVPRYGVTTDEWIRYALWVLAVLLLFAAGALAWRLIARRRVTRVLAEPAEERLPPPVADDRIVVADEAPVEVAAPAPHVEVAADGRRIIDADMHLTTRLGDDSDDLRRRYVEERFPEITKGAIALDDPDSVVKGARLFYEDGAIARAVELLQLAIERKPAELKTWLALFEIFRLERLAGEFSELARRFKEQHGASPFWPKVQYFGREIDPGNALYQAAPIDKFETIGPAQAKRIAADATFDPIAENWLGAPMDFQNEVLANELRKAIMHEAGLNEPDLVPNPMPALRNIEMFTVA